MTWEIATGLIALVGFCVTIGTVLAKLVHTLTRLDVTLGALIEEDRENNIKCKTTAAIYTVSSTSTRSVYTISSAHKRIHQSYIRKGNLF